MPIFMKYEGIDGESTTDSHSKWIELMSFQFGTGRAVASARGGSTREGSTVSVSEIVVTKQQDCASAKLFVASCTGQLNKAVQIDFVRTSKGEQQTYAQYDLEGTGISGYSVSSGGDRATESLSLNFDNIKFKYLAIGDDLSGDPETVGYNLATAKSSGGE